MKLLVLALSFFAVVPSFAQDVFVVTNDTTLGGVFDNCDANGACIQTQEMKQGKPNMLTLKQGQLVWISEIKGTFATVHFVSNSERSLARYGTMDTSNLQKVPNCEVTDVLSKGTCP